MHSLRLSKSVGRVVGAVVILAWCTACGENPPVAPTPPGPTISCPGSMDLQSADDNPVNVSYSPAMATGGIQPVTVQCSPATNTDFQVGTTTVTCTATDAQARASSCTFTVRVSPAPRLTATQFLAFGDSITYGVDSPSLPIRLLAPSYSYPFRLRDMLAAAYARQVFTMVNSGVPGEYVSKPHATGGPPGRLRLTTDLIAVRPEVLLLMEGTNDLLDFEEGATNAIRALESMVQDAKNRGARVFLATVPPQRPGGRRDRVARLIPTFNNQIRALAEQQGVVLVDIYAAIEPEIQTLIGTDDLHPTLAGFEVIAKTFFASIDANLQATSTTALSWPLTANLLADQRTQRLSAPTIRNSWRKPATIRAKPQLVEKGSPAEGVR